MTHFNENGEAVMVDVGEKSVTQREAVAQGAITLNDAAVSAVKSGSVKKGDVLGTARIAGIMAAKRTSGIIPLCHIVPLTFCGIEFSIEANTIICRCTVRANHVTGVEMEALTGVSTALLTVYDMCKALDKSMEIGSIHLIKKTGGKSGDYTHE